MMVIERFYFSTGGHIKAIFLKKTLDKSIKIEGFALKMMTFFKEAFQVNRKSYPERVRSALFHAINMEFTKNLREIHRSRGEFYAPKSVNRSFAARLWAANKDSAPENFTRYIQTHCKSCAILYGKLRVPSFQGGV